jgi:hypothetical protein
VEYDPSEKPETVIGIEGKTSYELHKDTLIGDFESTPQEIGSEYIVNF